jgi:hypothetical protein
LIDLSKDSSKPSPMTGVFIASTFPWILFILSRRIKKRCNLPRLIQRPGFGHWRQADSGRDETKRVTGPCDRAYKAVEGSNAYRAVTVRPERRRTSLSEG